MRKIRVLWMMMLVSSAASAQSIYVPHGFETGNDYQQMSPIEKQRYLVGVLDGFMAAPMLAVRDLPVVRALQRCDQKMGLTDLQLRAIVDKFVEDNPERWGDDMDELVLNAMIGACRKIGAPVN